VFAAQGRKRCDLFAADFKTRFAGRDSARLFLDGFDLPGVLAGRDPLNKSLFVWAKSFLPGYILNLLGDRMEMAHSIEGRVPFLDHHCRRVRQPRPRVVENPGHDRKVSAARGRQTIDHRHCVSTAKASVYDAASDLEANGAVSSNAAGHIARSCSRSLPFYDQKKVIALLDELPAMTDAERIGWDPVLMSVLSACVIQQRSAWAQSPLKPADFAFQTSQHSIRRGTRRLPFRTAARALILSKRR
jgi:asparagine synthase (glutamine-hydrolysing)